MAKGFPSEMVNHDLLSQDWEKILQVEGDTFQVNALNSAGTAVATGAVNTQVVSATQVNTAGKLIYLDVVKAGLSAGAIAQIGISGDTGARFPGYADMIMFPSGGGTIQVSAKKLLRPFQFQNGLVTLSVRNNQTAGSVTYTSTISANAIRITDDLNFSADHLILAVGDSTLNGTGPTSTQAMWPFLARDYLRGEGHNCRVVLKSVSGSTSSEHEAWRKAGWHRSVLQRPSMGFYNLGLNDAANAVPLATYLANVQAFWNDWKTWVPNAPLIVVAPTPLESDTKEAAAAVYRSAVVDWVASVDSPKLKVANPSALWDRKVTSNYAATDTAGERVHYTDGPNALVAGLVQNVISTNGLKPTR